MLRTIHALIISLFLIGSVHAGANQWSSDGPYGGLYRTFAFHDKDPNLIFAAGFSGLHRSEDGGKHWEELFKGQSHYYPIRIHPHHPERIVGIHDWAVLESMDRGKNWQIVAELLIDDVITDFEFHPNNPKILYAATEISGLFKSKDGGITWVKTGRGIPVIQARESRNIPQIEIDPLNPRVLYFLHADNRIYKSTNGAKSWRNISNKLAGTSYASAALKIDPSNPRTLFFGNFYGLFVSRDAGTTWQATGWNFPVRDIAFHAGKNQKIFAAGEGIGASSDDGRTWSVLNVPGVTNRYIGVGVHPSRGTLFLGTDGQGLFYSTNQGKSWKYPELPIRLNQFFLSKLRLEPRSGRVLALTSREIFISKNLGKKWSPLIRVEFPLQYVVDFRIHPKNDKYWIAAGSEPAIAISMDSGESWEAIQQFSSAKSIALDPTDENVIYLVPWETEKLNKSVDKGKTWKQIPGVDQIINCYDEGKHLYLSTQRSSEKLVFTRDGGETWINITRGLKGDFVTALAEDPKNPDILYVSLEDAVIYYGASAQALETHLYVSFDGGKTWQLKNQGLENDDVSYLRVDPRNPQRVFASISHGLYYSENRGESWSPFSRNGLEGRNYHFHDLLFHPSNLNLIFGATSGGVLMFEEK